MLVGGAMAYLMTKTSFYEKVFYDWVSASTVNLAEYEVGSQELSALLCAMLGMEDSAVLHVGLGLTIASALLVFAFRARHFRTNTNNVIAAVVVGLAVLAAWYLTGGPLGQQVMVSIDWLDQKPLGVGVQSFTFINPMGETLHYASSPANFLRITFGVVAVLGVVAGSLVCALASRKFSLVQFRSTSDFIKHLVGGVLLGIGGVLAMGCTIGQGISGVSTLALGSVVALVSIIFDSALTMKIQYYKMVYEEEATFISAFLSPLVDMRLLPDSLRRLEQP
jgi:hypothetical protein